MRFYFHLESGNERILDFEGAELADLKAAHRHALRFIELAALFISDDPDWRDWRIEVASDRRERILTILPARVPLMARIFAILDS